MLAQGTGWVGNWSPGIGDPTVGGWVTVAAYGMAALLCFRAYLGRADVITRREKRVWLVLTAGMAALGINKQLDLQTALVEAAREIARHQGWYENRRPVQAAFVLGVAACALVTLVWMWRGAAQAKAGQGLRRAFFGAVLLAAFVVVRAASFHHVDMLLGESWAGVRLNVALELCGIGWVGFGAVQAGSQRRS